MRDAKRREGSGLTPSLLASIETSAKDGGIADSPLHLARGSSS